MSLCCLAKTESVGKYCWKFRALSAVCQTSSSSVPSNKMGESMYLTTNDFCCRWALMQKREIWQYYFVFPRQFSLVSEQNRSVTLQVWQCGALSLAWVARNTACFFSSSVLVTMAPPPEVVIILFPLKDKMIYKMLRL